LPSYFWAMSFRGQANNVSGVTMVATAASIFRPRRFALPANRSRSGDSVGWEDASNTIQEIDLRAVLRDVYPMVIRLVVVPDSLDLPDFDDIFHAVLGWDSGIGFAFQIQGQEFNSFQRKIRAKKLRNFRLHRQEKLLYTLGALDQWEWELRVVDLQD